MVLATVANILTFVVNVRAFLLLCQDIAKT
jgi:hypothetical protein